MYATLIHYYQTSECLCLCLWLNLIRSWNKTSRPRVAAPVDRVKAQSGKNRAEQDGPQAQQVDVQRSGHRTKKHRSTQMYYTVHDSKSFFNVLVNVSFRPVSALLTLWRGWWSDRRCISGPGPGWSRRYWPRRTSHRRSRSRTCVFSEGLGQSWSEGYVLPKSQKRIFL